MNQLTLGLLLTLFSITLTVHAQKMPKKVLAKPHIFERPFDIDGFHYNKTGKNKDRIDVPWIVICDRSEEDLTKTYEAGAAGSPSFSHLKFKDWYYVVDENEQWLHLVKTNVEGREIIGDVKDFGWINKKSVLLWTSGLLDSKTGINKKAFLLNKKENIEDIPKYENKDIVKIFDGPKSGTEIEKKETYEFYFILKKENSRYLLSKEAQLTIDYNLTDALVGWVSQKRVEDWNTRICMEPNFEAPAFEERKQNKNFQVKAFFEETAADKHALEGIVDPLKVEWENDVVGITMEKLAKSNPRRFKGGVVRFPMLGHSKNYFRTGVIGTILVSDIHGKLDTLGELNYANMVKKLKESESTRDNYNVFFLIEDSKNSARFKPAILEMIKEVGQEFLGVPNLQFAAAIYGNTPEENQLFEMQKLTDDIEKVKNFVSTSSFDNKQDNGDHTALYYGLNQALLQGGFNNEQTNILYLIGGRGDFSADKERNDCTEENESLEYTIQNKLASYNVHLVGIEYGNDSKRHFIDQVKNLMLESAKLQYNQYKGVSQYMPKLTGLHNPRLPDFDKDNILRMKGGPSQGIFMKAPSQGVLTQERMISFGKETAQEIKTFIEDFWIMMNQIIVDGGEYKEQDAGPLTSPAMQEIFKLLDAGAITTEDMEKILKQNYKLYTEVYLPKKIKGAKYNALSYVLFMPEKDLEDYKLTLDYLSDAIDNKPANELREILFHTLMNLAKKYKGRRDEKYHNFSVGDLRKSMQGVYKDPENDEQEHEGLELSQEQDFVIKHVLSKRKFPDDKLRAYCQSLKKKAKKIRSVYKEREQHEFSYHSRGNIYFWIPIEWTF